MPAGSSVLLGQLQQLSRNALGTSGVKTESADLLVGQWRRSVTLDETCALLADVQTLVDIPPRIQKLVRRTLP